MSTSMMARFAVVRFKDEEETVSEVPVSWLIDDNKKCLWPSKSKNISTLITKCVEPSATWQEFPVVVEYFCSNVEEARKRANDIESGSEDLGRGNRKIKTNIRYVSSSSDESTYMSKEEFGFRSDLPKFPSVGLNVNNNAVTIEETLEQYEEEARSPFMQHYEGQDNSLSQQAMSQQAIPQQVISQQAISQQALSRQAISQQAISQSEVSSIKELIHSCLETQISVIQENFDKVFRVLAEQKMQIDSLHEKLDSLKIDKQPIQSDRLGVIKQMIPVRGFEDLQKLEESLSEEKNSCNFKSYIASIGGKSAKETTMRVMSSLYDNELGTKCSWWGRGKENFKFKDLVSVELVKDVIMNQFPNVTHKEFEIFASEWLRLSNQRLKREKKE